MYPKGGGVHQRGEVGDQRGEGYFLGEDVCPKGVGICPNGKMYFPRESHV